MAVKHKNKKWIFSVTRNLSFWHQHVSGKGYISGMPKFGIEFTLTSAAVTFNGTETHVFFDETELANFADKVTQYVMRKSNVVSLEKKYRSFAKEFIASVDGINRKLTPASFELFLNRYTDYCAGLMLTLALGRMVHRRLVERLDDLKIGNIDNIVSLITYPDESTPLMESEKEMVRIGALCQKSNLESKKIESLLKRWLQKFQHIPVNFCEEPWIMDDAKKMLSEFLKKDCKKIAAEQKRNHGQKIKEKKNLLKQIKDQMVENLSYAIAKGTIFNEFRKNIFSRVSLEYRDVFSELASRGGSKDWRDCFYLTSDEMLDLASGKKINLSVLKKKRMVAGSMSDFDANVKVMNKALLKKFVDDLPQTLKTNGKENEKRSGISEVRGTVANKGKITGVAKIVRNRKEFEKFKQGDVLITAMTSVDFVPIMSIAAAFVTNEGGITSHASIVSREMNKPCIIGTKIATEVFRDGDLVEVDAEKGIVKLIK
ncbi:MAG: PEP-utilizing enzyme [Candidatus Paceibacterota bacterium]